MSTSEIKGENTRKVTIKGKKSLKNKKISTKDNCKERKSTSQNKNSTSQDKQKNSLTENDNPEYSYLKELEIKTEELESQLSKIKLEYETEKKNAIHKIEDYNKRIEEAGKELKNVSNINLNLINNLKNIQKKLDVKFEKASKQKKTFPLKRELNEESKERIIENLKKLQQHTQKIKENYQKLLADFDGGLIEKKGTEITKMNEEIKKLNEDNKVLRENECSHRKCSKEIQNLTTVLNLLKNALEFEIKKGEMYNTNDNKDNAILEESWKNNTNYYKDKKDKSKPMYYMFGVKKKDKPKKLNKSAGKIILSEINSMKKVNNYLTNKSIDKNRKKIKQIKLFDDEEIPVIDKIMPENYRIIMSQKFDEIKNQKEDIEERFEDFKEKKKENEEISTNIEALRNQFKDLRNKKIDLMQVNKSINLKINNIKIEISQTQKNLEKMSKILQIKEKENNFLKAKEKEINKN